MIAWECVEYGAVHKMVQVVNTRRSNVLFLGMCVSVCQAEGILGRSSRDEERDVFFFFLV